MVVRVPTDNGIFTLSKNEKAKLKGLSAVFRSKSRVEKCSFIFIVANSIIVNKVGKKENHIFGEEKLFDVISLVLGNGC